MSASRGKASFNTSQRRVGVGVGSGRNRRRPEGGNLTGLLQRLLRHPTTSSFAPNLPQQHAATQTLTRWSLRIDVTASSDMVPQTLVSGLCVAVARWECAHVLGYVATAMPHLHRRLRISIGSMLLQTLVFRHTYVKHRYVHRCVVSGVATAAMGSCFHRNVTPGDFRKTGSPNTLRWVSLVSVSLKPAVSL